MKEQNPLFEFIKIIFEKPDEYKKIPKIDKAKYFFMLSRLMSIQFPVQAQAFNHKKIPQAETADYWQQSLTKLYKKTPSWIYIKTKKSTENKNNIKMPSDEAIQYYLERTKMSKRELNDSIKLLGDQVLDPIRKIETIMNE